MPKFEQYEHHGVNVTVDSSLKGKHRDHCLCWQGCKKFTPEDRENNCPIANAVYKNCVDFNIVSPVYECAHAEF